MRIKLTNVFFKQLIQKSDVYAIQISNFSISFLVMYDKDHNAFRELMTSNKFWELDGRFFTYHGGEKIYNKTLNITKIWGKIQC